MTIKPIKTDEAYYQALARLNEILTLQLTVPKAMKQKFYHC